MYRISQISLIVVLLSSCVFSEESSEILSKKLHGRWELVGIYVDGVFKTDTFSTASSINKSTGLEQRLYNVFTDSGSYQHIYNDDSFVMNKLDMWVLDIDTESVPYTFFWHAYTPDNDVHANTRRLFQVTFYIEMNNRPSIVSHSSKSQILQLTDSKLIIQTGNKKRHYKKYGNVL